MALQGPLELEGVFWTNSLQYRVRRACRARLFEHPAAQHLTPTAAPSQCPGRTHCTVGKHSVQRAVPSGTFAWRISEGELIDPSSSYVSGVPVGGRDCVYDRKAAGIEANAKLGFSRVSGGHLRPLVCAAAV